jgi:lysozyme family protein
MADLDQSIARVIQAEGGYVDNPLDTGGPTRWGVTQTDLDSWNKDHSGLPASVSDLTIEQATQIYAGSQQWINPAWAAIGSQWLCDFLVSWSVLRGQSNAVRAFQASEGLSQDGVWGPETAKRALLFISDEAGNVKFEALSQIIDVLVANPKDLEFAHGWRNRLREI